MPVAIARAKAARPLVLGAGDDDKWDVAAAPADHGLTIHYVQNNVQNNYDMDIDIGARFNHTDHNYQLNHSMLGNMLTLTR